MSLDELVPVALTIERWGWLVGVLQADLEMVSEAPESLRKAHHMAQLALISGAIIEQVGWQVPK